MARALAAIHGGRRDALVAAVVALAALAAFAPARDFGYVQDDRLVIQSNPLVESGDLAAIFSTDWTARDWAMDRSLYRPVTVATFALERRVVSRLDPRLSHRVNLALHAAVSLLVMAWGRRLGAGPLAAGAGALLFAAHPVHGAAVANLVGRAELLAALLSLAALLAAAAAAADRGPVSPWRSRAASWGAGVLTLGALGSKESALALPALLLTQEVLLSRRAVPAGRARFLRSAAVLAPIVLASVAYLILRTRAILAFPGNQPVVALENPLVDAGGVGRWATALAMAARYAGLLVFPRSLSPDYTGRAILLETSFFAPLPLLGLATLAALAWAFAAGWLPRSRRDAASTPVVPMAAAAALGPYLLVGNLIVLSGAGFAERLLYVPSCGAALLAGAGLARLESALAGRLAAPPGAVRYGLAALVLAAATLGVLASRGDSRKWRNEESLFLAAAEAQPGSARAPYVLARLRLDGGHADEARRWIDRCLDVRPEYGECWFMRGELLEAGGALREAEAALRRAVALGPQIGEAHRRLGTNLARQGRYAEAERELRKGLVSEPLDVDGMDALARVLFRLGRYGEAAGAWRAAVARGREDLRGALAEAERRAAASDPGDGRDPARP